ncbi:Imitation switch two complex protein 1 [Psilocybe cubensis]|uniref:Imitation switch two complex protein 1 n=2 Tax=Psilocybe cubensis TaxID=181762 RepID=A0ACB8HGF0_PSICU|nr:Imitation switch two complex protein 1 [Psilocybe cubensis]KAH9486764.1 Imitation switch two complex protein 1 [Psilocybe cubensis]
MPTCRRKRVVLTEPSQSLLLAAQSDPTRHVFYLEQTGEIFETYEAYAARMSFYRLKQFQCEVTGKSGLDYFQAVESERQEARTLHSRFSEPLKPAVLKAVQWQVMGRLDHLVEAVYERFKDRYFPGERVLIDLSGVKYYARVEKVYPPKYNADAKARDAHMDAPSSSTIDDEPPHVIGGDLKVPAKDAYAKDDPTLYYYWVHLTDLERDKSHEKGKGSVKISDQDKRLVGSLIEVQCSMMSRDRLSFSKSILRRFIRDCVDRDAAVASPWTVKPPIAKRYGVDSVMPEETRQGVENIKKGEIDKRKKIWEDKEGPPTKKQKKMTAAQEEKARALAVAAEKREREAREKAEKQRLAKEEAERIAAEKKKKKPVRYPTEDLDVRIGDKEKKAGMRVTRPLANKLSLPFNDIPGAFESFLMAWNFLVVYGQPLHLSVFSLDELEHALRHSVADQPCSLLAEIHSTLIYNLRTVAFVRHSALLSLLKRKEDLEAAGKQEVPVLGLTIDELVAAMADVGNNWERVPLRYAEVRDGWEEALVGCLKDHANTTNFPRIQEILTKLLFAPADTSSESGAPTPNDITHLKNIAHPSDTYYNLPAEDRIAILSFMCNLAVSSKAIHAHMESCEEQLTALRKEKIEVNRQKKQYQEEMGVLLDETKEEESLTPNGNGDDIAMPESSELSDSEGGSESTSAAGKKSTRQKDLRLKAHTIAHSKEREAARAKQASQKQAIAEHRRLDEEVNKLERRLEGIEREFRKLLGAVRVKPLGRDRFYNRIWWFDGMGSASLVGSGGIALYGTGRLFIQGPSEFDLQQLEKKALEDNEDIDQRRREEEGEEGMLKSSDWAAYTELEEIEAFVSWLNPKGHRELALKTLLTKWWVHITAGMRKRTADLNSNAKLPDARRSARKSALGYDLSRDPYMLWTNRRAINSS